MRPNRSRGAKSSSGGNLAKLVAIGLSSALLIACFFLFTREPQHQASSGTTDSLPRRTTLVSDATVKGHAVTLVAGAPTAPQATISSPAPRIEVGKHDERHPDNVAQMIKDGSSHDEHKHSLIQSLIKQKSDTGDISSGKISPSPSPSSLDDKVASHKSLSGRAAAIKHATEHVKEAAQKLSPSLDDNVTSKSLSGRAAAIKHAADHLKEAAKKLYLKNLSLAGNTTSSVVPKKANELSDLAENATDATSTSAVLKEAKELSDLAENATEATPVAKNTSSATHVKKVEAIQASGKSSNKTKAPPIDLLAYSKAQGQPGDTMHVLFTSNGSPYQNFQARIMVGGFRLAQKMPGGDKMVALTRILHRTTPDEVMEEIPTFRADPLQPECDKWCWFPVADRANAVQQWIDAAHADPSIVKAPWILLLETDYVWIKPLAAVGSAYESSVPGLAFKFDYIAPQHYIVQQILKDKCPDCNPQSVPGSGPAPVLARFSDFRAATPLWEELSLWIETHKEAKDSLGWVREMYAWDIGVAAHKLNILTQGHPTTNLISQPPHDTHAYNATMYHYTWGVIVKDSNGTEWWKWDKRFYTEAKDALKVPLLKLPPPLIDGLKMHDGMPFTQDLHDVLTDMLSLMNKAIKTLPDLSTTKK